MKEGIQGNSGPVCCAGKPLYASLIHCAIVQKSLGNWAALRKIIVRYEQIVPFEDNVDLDTAKYEALKAALAEVEVKRKP